MTARLLVLAAALILAAAPAHAGPVTAAFTAVFTAFKASTVYAFLTTNLFGRALASVALSALSAALAPRPRQPGIQTETTQTGGTNPQSFVLGRYATSGYAVCPPMSHGRSGETRNAFLTYVIDLGDVPGMQLLRLVLNDQYVTLGTTPHPDYGLPVLGKFEGFAWVRYHDGTQTAADAMLIDKYGSYPERPWSADMVGRGVCYAVLTFRYSRKRWNGLPTVRFEVGGIPLYDPRLDSTVGGAGAQRWTDRTTWAPSNNPAVQIYNVVRGITLPDGSVWGGGFAAADLPLASWFAAMNDCDAAIALAAGGSEPQFRTGFEVRVDDEPAAVLEELLKGCAGQMAEIGGAWKIRVGAPGLSVLSFTDADVVIDRPQDLDPFPGLDRTFNAIHASYPEPESLWEAKDAPPRYNATWEAADQNRRLTADLSLPAVPYGGQVQRIMRAYIEEERRFRRHVLTLPPDAAAIEPLDAVSWTSAKNGYTARGFEVAETVTDLRTGLQRVSLRERNAADHVWTPGMALPVQIAAALPVEPVALGVPGWAVSAATVDDAAANARRPALRLTWDAAQLEEVEGIAWEVRLAAGATVLRGTTQDLTAGSLLVAGGILPATAYEARARVISEGPADWSAWSPATTAAVLLDTTDLAANAVTRPIIADFAVSDLLQVIELGPFLAGAAGDQIERARLALGPVPYGTILKRGVVYEARAPSMILTVRVQRRRKIGGVWDDWSTLDTVEVSGTSAWAMFADSGTLAGAYEDFEYRVTTDRAGGSGTAEVIRNIYITVIEVTK